MKNLYLIVLNIILFLIFPGEANIVFGEKLIEENHLLFSTPRQGGAFQLMRLNLRGEEEVFSQQILRSRQIYLSPDRLKVSALEPDSNIIVLDRNGEEIFQFNLDLHSAEEGQGWYSWGWQGTDKIVVSQIVNGTLKFYEVDLNTSPLNLQEIETLNDFFIWDITQKISAVELSDLYRFSPNFRYAMTPPVIYATSLDDFLSTTIFWDLQEKTAQAIEDTMSWWQEWTGFPAWSNSENAVVFNKIEADGDATIYIYDYESPPRRLTNLSCNRCFLNYFSWSPTDKFLAFWQSRDLIVVNLETNETTTIISNVNFRSPIYWSPDERYIATGGGTSGVKFIDVEAKEIVLSHPISGQIIGWIL